MDWKKIAVGALITMATIALYNTLKAKVSALSFLP
jgi:hypothetical protein